MTTLKRCLTCHKLTRGSHCKQHDPKNAYRSREYRDLASRIIASWIAARGFTCPGAADLNHEPHHCTDLTIDHIDDNAWNNAPSNLRVLCREFNTRKRNAPKRKRDQAAPSN